MRRSEGRRPIARVATIPGGAMGTVIEFPKARTVRTDSIDLDDLCSTGEVLLFTGVRYTELEAQNEVGPDDGSNARGNEQDATG